MPNIDEIIDKELKILKQNRVDSSAFEIKMLIGHILGVEAKSVSHFINLDEDQVERLDKLVQQRLRHKPIDKIIGQRGFYKYDFVVNEEVLSPRPDTEILVENALERLHGIKNPKILELGVGSGCIILSLLADLPDAKGVGIDISQAALALTDINAEKINIEPERLKLIKASWFERNIIKKLKDYMPFDIVVSNPPYIPSAEIETLDDEVKNYDPRSALDGGADGLKDYDAILNLSQQALKPEGILIFEAADGCQLKAIADKAQAYDFEFIKICQDLGDRDRCIILKK